MRLGLGGGNGLWMRLGPGGGNGLWMRLGPGGGNSLKDLDVSSLVEQNKSIQTTLSIVCMDLNCCITKHCLTLQSCALKGGIEWLSKMQQCKTWCYEIINAELNITLNQHMSTMRCRCVCPFWPSTHTHTHTFHSTCLRCSNAGGGPGVPH